MLSDTEKIQSIDNVLKAHLEILMQDLEQDDDNVIVVYGDEGAGKSLFVSQIVFFINTYQSSKFGVTANIHYIGQDYIKSSLDGFRLQKNILDESRRTLSKMRSMSSTNQDFMNFLAECRSQKQWHIIILPSYFDVDKDVAIRRLKLLIKIVKYRDPTTKKLVKGNFEIIDMKDKNKVKELYYSEFHTTPDRFIAHRGKFKEWWGWNEEEYKAKKEEEKKKYYIKKEDDDKPKSKKQDDEFKLLVNKEISKYRRIIWDVLGKDKLDLIDRNIELEENLVKI